MALEENINNIQKEIDKKKLAIKEQLSANEDKIQKAQMALDISLLVAANIKKYKEERRKNKVFIKKGTIPKGIGGIILILLKQALSSSNRFQKRLDIIINNISQSCPNEQELKSLIEDKNNLSKALDQIYPTLDNVNKIGNTAKIIINALQVITTVIKMLPLPTAVPPGIGIPTNIITKLSAILVKSDKTLDKTASTISQITIAINIIKNIIDNTRQLLLFLDKLLEACNKQNQTQVTSPIISSNIFPGEYKGFTYNKEYVNITEIRLYAKQINPNTQVLLNGDSFHSPNDEQLITNIKVIIDNYLNPKPDNKISDYKGFNIIIETNKNNILLIQQRRASASNNNITLSTEYSFVTNTDLLISEVKFIIDDYLIKGKTGSINSTNSNNKNGGTGVENEMQSSSIISSIMDNAYSKVTYNIIDSYFLDIKTKLSKNSIIINPLLLLELETKKYNITYTNDKLASKTIYISFNNFNQNIRAIEGSIKKEDIKSTTIITKI